MKQKRVHVLRVADHSPMDHVDAGRAVEIKVVADAGITGVFSGKDYDFYPRKIELSELSQEIDFAFMALHGRPGEDGTLPELLEQHDIPYNGSRPGSSSLTIDKYRTNEILGENGILVAAHRMVYKEDWANNADKLLDEVESSFGYPLIAKPADDGCSSAVKKIDTREELIDFAKAMAALIACEGPPIDYLEVIGSGRPLESDPIPMIALPTTAGTGAEVTKNAVISVPEHGLKVSLRDPRLVPDIAIVDPDLMQGAPRRVALAAGLDAITQVIEPYLSIRANPMTDALCEAAIPVGLNVLQDLVENDAADAWDRMAWVSTCGGLALSNAGLGAVHGFAGVIGGKTNAPHGEICGVLLPAVLGAHLKKALPNTKTCMRLEWVIGHIDACFAGGAQGAGLSKLALWSRSQGLRTLVQIGLTAEDHAEVAEQTAKTSSMKGNPFTMSQKELLQVLRQL